MGKSIAEIECVELWESIEREKFINVKALLQFRDSIGKLHDKCMELRKSRDNWRARYEALCKG